MWRLLIDGRSKIGGMDNHLVASLVLVTSAGFLGLLAPVVFAVFAPLGMTELQWIDELQTVRLAIVMLSLASLVVCVRGFLKNHDSHD